MPDQVLKFKLGDELVHKKLGSLTALVSRVGIGPDSKLAYQLILFMGEKQTKDTNKFFLVEEIDRDFKLRRSDDEW